MTCLPVSELNHWVKFVDYLFVQAKKKKKWYNCQTWRFSETAGIPLNYHEFEFFKWVVFGCVDVYSISTSTQHFSEVIGASV